MSSPASTSARLLRAGLVSLWACLAACASHVVGSGEPPSIVAFVPVAVGTSALAWCVSGRRWGTGTVLGLLVLPQAAIHLLSGYLHGHPLVPSAEMTVAHVVGLVVIAMAMARVELLWWSWWQRLTSLLRTARRAVPPFAIPASLGPGIVPVHGSALSHVLVRRGPPLS